MARLLGRGAEKILAEQNGTSNSDLAKELYNKALGRNPTSGELNTAREILGQPAQKAGMEDLMWALAMLPEFQLIY